MSITDNEHFKHFNCIYVAAIKGSLEDVSVNKIEVLLQSFREEVENENPRVCKIPVMDYVQCGLLIVLILVAGARSNDDEDATPGTTTDNNDISQEEIDDSLILDYGVYTTISWHYQNKQQLPHDHITTWYEECYNYYVKCVTTLEAPAPVCIFYTQRYRTGYDVMDTYCDAYLENCRIGYRYWRLIGYGRCELSTYFFGAGKDYLIEV